MPLDHFHSHWDGMGIEAIPNSYPTVNEKKCPSVKSAKYVDILGFTLLHACECDIITSRVSVTSPVITKYRSIIIWDDSICAVHELMM